VEERLSLKMGTQWFCSTGRKLGWIQSVAAKYSSNRLAGVFQCFSGPYVSLPRDGVQSGLAVDREVCSALQILSQQAARVLV
jgi:hypothetical protein